MFRKVKEIATHPYAAPVAEAAKSIFEFATHPLERFVRRLKEGMDDSEYYTAKEQEQPKLLRTYKRLFYTDDSAGVISFVGALIGGVGGAVATGIAAGAAGAGWLGITGACALAVGVGVAAGPFLMAGIVATVAGCIGSIISGVPGCIKGCKMAIDHHKQLKAQGHVAAAIPAQAQNPDFTQALGKALAPFNDLTQEQRAAYVKMMCQQYQDAARGQSEKLLQALDSLPEKERDALLRGLKPRLKDEFEALAQRDANNSTVLQKEIQVDGPIKLKMKRPVA